MQGNKTHQQQRNIIEKRVDTSNGGEDFDARADLNRNPAAREAFRQGEETINPVVGDVSMRDDPSIIRGVNQESEHRKGSGH
ncbi:hypothetical protein [Rhizobium sp. SSA_523]|uniref:hypothetical protein n=1 Tax=Rhizobium sp. SSA_523 TaxID=2952477 RepID=UPI0020912874|nr:hypothetical protein [Rhizobium sp. SSA_523]MCO5731705.1 hypothetical protein [Rhizobium sp. SSA_523]WKC22919.1 hypothetical protein QTJ18_19010 [Rhizobium sp. SSA_523]